MYIGRDMPSHMFHGYVSKKVLGKAHPEVDSAMDWVAKYRMQGHRRYFHDPVSIALLFGGDTEQTNAALLHLFMDKLSEDPMTNVLIKMIEESMKRKK